MGDFEAVAGLGTYGERDPFCEFSSIGYCSITTELVCGAILRSCWRLMNGDAADHSEGKCEAPLRRCHVIRVTKPSQNGHGACG
jgi:hypothetical protein